MERRKQRETEGLGRARGVLKADCAALARNGQ